jgi:hypothetical protein
MVLAHIRDEKNGEGPSPDDEFRFDDPRAKFIHERIRHYIKHYREKRDKNRLLARTMRSFVILCGATITILLGIKGRGPYEELLSAIAFTLSAAVTAATSWDAFADHHWKWIRYRGVLHRLFQIRDRFKYSAICGKDLTQDELDEVFKEMQTAVQDLDDRWTEQQMLNRDNSPKPSQRSAVAAPRSQ